VSESPSSGRCHVAHGEPAVGKCAPENVPPAPQGRHQVPAGPDFAPPGLPGFFPPPAFPRLARRGLNDAATPWLGTGGKPWVNGYGPMAWAVLDRPFGGQERRWQRPAASGRSFPHRKQKAADLQSRYALRLHDQSGPTRGSGPGILKIM